MKRMKRATFTAAALLSCTLAFSGCSLIGQAIPDQDGTAGEQANADGQDQSNQDQGDQNGQQSSADQNGQQSNADQDGQGQGDQNGQDSSSDQSAPNSSSSSSDGSSGSGSGASSGSQGQVNIGESFEDPEMQDKIEVLSAVRNFDSSKKATTIELGGEVVLLEVKITPGQKYSGLIQSGALKISEDGVRTSGTTRPTASKKR